MAGTFTMTGRLTDAGTINRGYRLAGARIDATATPIGTHGILTIALRGTLSGITDNRQTAAGSWAACGGTAAYKRLRGHGTGTPPPTSAPRPRA